MTKADLVDRVTELGDLTRRDSEVIVETLFDSITFALQHQDKVEIRGFGSFRTRQRNPRTGRNPKTGARVDVPAKRVPYFKPAKSAGQASDVQASNVQASGEPAFAALTRKDKSPTSKVPSSKNPPNKAPQRPPSA